MADTSDGPNGTHDGESSSHTGEVVTVATTNNLHQPGFLRIPPELRLEIYELSMPRMTTILVYAETDTSTAFHNRDVSYSIGNDRISLQYARFFPRLPPISQVCRRTRSEYPFYDYYANNTFLFADSMLHSSVLDRFLAGRGDAVRAMSHVKVNFINLTNPWNKKDLKIRLSMTKQGTGTVSVENISISSPYGNDHMALCLCGGLGWAGQSTQADSSILEKLRDLVAYCEAFSAAMRSKANLEEKVCERCQKIRVVQAPEPPPRSDEMRQKLKDIAAKTAEMEELRRRRRERLDTPRYRKESGVLILD
ncbi:hypothetical protein LTS10_013046 [Elasticomyces elasticus]|nr:hypothetical protein LTS10_013046 [Elasticomyces elasticus]